MILKGKRVLLTQPPKPETTVILSPEIERKMQLDNARLWTHLEVFFIGDDVTTVKVGDLVYLPIEAITMATVMEIDMNVKLMVSEYDIAIIW